MPIEIQLDEITRSSFEADTKGIRYLQAGAAKGIDETDPAKLLGRLPGLSGVDPNGAPVQIPQLGTRHKVYSQCMVTGYRVSGIGSVDVQFHVVYESPAGYGLNFIIGIWYPFRNNSIIEEETSLDDDNAPILVSYTPPGANISTDRLASVRRRTAVVDLTLTGIFLEDVKDAEDAAVGCINIDKWRRKRKSTWLCTGINSRPDIFGYTWRKTATFSYNPRTWDQFEYWRDPNTGIAPSDVSAADADDLVKMDMTEAQAFRNGITRARVQSQADFSAAFGDE